MPLSPGQHVRARRRRVPARSREADGARLRLGELARAVEADTPSVAPEVAERLAPPRRSSRPCAIAMFLKTCVDDSHTCRRSRPSGTPSSARQSRFMLPPPPGMSPTPTSTRPAYVSAAACTSPRAEAELEPAAERHAVRRRDDRHASRTSCAGTRPGSRCTIVRMLLPLPSAPPPSTTRNRFAPTQKCSPWLATTSARKSRLGLRDRRRGAS